MRIGVLTSSRAEYGVYRPLLKALYADPFFVTEMIVFGTHLSEKHGATIKFIIDDGYNPKYRIHTVPDSDSPEAIADAIGQTISKFSVFWSEHKSDFDLILAIGDRYEMFGAVVAALPFGIRIAHIHGGEATLGAIDNALRHSISHMSSYHFTSTEIYTQRLKSLLDESHHVYTVGALSLDNLKEITIPDRKEFLKRYEMNDERFCLVTFHPETVGWERNEAYTRELCAAMAEMEEYKVVTMPNADTAGNTVRKILIEFAEGRTDVRLIESLGTIGYFAFIQHSEFLLGNSSSGIIEAGSFGKYVINTGDRQKGRVFGPNVMQCEIKREKILEAVNRIRSLPPAVPHSIYGDGFTAILIVKHMKEIYNSFQ